MKRIEKAEQLLEQCEQDLEKIREFQAFLKKAESNRNKLNEYYATFYMKDYEKFAQSESQYRVLNQDSIWNVLSDQYQEKIEIAKVIINSI